MNILGFYKEFALLRQRWHIILACLVLQYVHGIFTQLAYRMHQPAQVPLHDVGFALIPELPAEWRWLSEAMFAGLLVTFILWTFVPLLWTRRFSCVVLWTRLLTVLVVCQSLRIISFSVTQLPGPAPHCRLGMPTAHRAPASHWSQHVVVDVSRQLARSCGDLIFSSHMTFVLLGVLSYQHYGGHKLVKALVWAAGAVLAGLIISARKHYTVDIIIAWYTVPLVYCCLHMYWGGQQLEQDAQQEAAGHMAYSACSSSCDSCNGALPTCYSPLKKPSSSAVQPRSSSPLQKQVQLADVDGSAVITLSGAALKLPTSTTVAARTPLSQQTSPAGGWSARQLAAVWPLGHRRAGSEASSTGSSHSSSSGGCHSYGGSSSQQQLADGDPPGCYSC